MYMLLFAQSCIFLLYPRMLTCKIFGEFSRKFFLKLTHLLHLLHLPAQKAQVRRKLPSKRLGFLDINGGLREFALTLDLLVLIEFKAECVFHHFAPLARVGIEYSIRLAL